MPIYDYACDKCGYRFEVRQSFEDAPLTECPECTGRIRRIVHPAGVIFKGTGWYSTDNRRNDEAREPKPAVQDKSASEEKAAADA